MTDESDTEVEWPKNEEKFYYDAKEYWSQVPTTVDGMLGGFEKISPTDINGSKAFLRPFLKIGKGKTNTHRALDCGAGIGRITKRLLLPMFDTVDMVELNQKFLDSAKSFIGQDVSRVDRFICSGLQDFTPEAGRYDLIWTQWVLGHLTEDHLVAFFKRCKAGLATDGLIVVKENVSGSEKTEFDELDSSFTRCKESYTTAMRKAGLTILKEERQKGFPKGLYSVFMFALK
ncbi:N-terminal Xaa-Pro-Lys N-methyltransferase 1-like [Mercenaria mercenaria]|uniref:N-terminal Xaa-Pro-Lys N-methyltransferase 1-like n=1 Tax=Mercenaria mercenaria TaxID=6596 RepID=UPI001E1E20D0|nr:N-terminal Xaa-Pro-Lys N-methyltransferase 1-like [Mercenaria mercenaria]